MLYSGKVKQVWSTDDDDILEFRYTDQISVFDQIIPSLIPRKGESLNRTTCHWFKLVEDEGICQTHIVERNAADRCLVRKVEVYREPGTVPRDGEWVFVPEKPFTPGSRQLGLKMLIDGQKSVASDDMVVLVVPEPKQNISGRKTNKQSQPLALKFSKKGGASSVLQKPTENLTIGTLSLDTVDYNETGQLIISGRATPESTVIVYLNNLVTGKSVVDKNGSWRMRPDSRVQPGLYTLRADQVALSGKVLSRISMPFSRAEPINEIPSEPFVIVQPGNSLWRIARKTFGSGFGFTTIYEANKEQIKDPDLIFPGQVFVLPSNNN